MILRTDYFESAFAGMLKWENAMAREVLPLFGNTDNAGGKHALI